MPMVRGALGCLSLTDASRRVKGLKLYRSKYEYSETPFCKGGNGSCSCFDDAYTLSEFMREPDGGFQTICDFISFYLRHQDRYKRFLLVRCVGRASQRERL
jgi:hypothetical protein